MGGTSFDPQVEATRQADVLAQAVEKGVITGVEAETYSSACTQRSKHTGLTVRIPGRAGMMPPNGRPPCWKRL